MDISFIETLLLAFPEMQENITVDQIKPYWEVLEDLVEQERVLSLGICDLDKASLEELYEWAKVCFFSDSLSVQLYVVVIWIGI